MEIRIKPKVIASSNGFDFTGRPKGSREVFEIISNYLWSSRKETDGITVYWREKHRAKLVVTPKLTPSGKPSKKAPDVKKIPTHWKYKVWFIPKVIIELLALEGKVIKQYKNHWSIESK